MPFDLAWRYLEICYTSHNWDRLEELLATDLTFTGPFFSCTSATEYVESLRSDPPDGWSYEMIHTCSTDDCAVLIYRFAKRDVECLISQLFEVQRDKIQKITLIFDSAQFPGS